VGHLTNKQHRLPRKEAVAISDEIEHWHGIARFPSEFDLPKYVEEAVDGMPVYTDGVKCEVDKGQCAYVCCNIDVLKEHWRKTHGFSVGQRRGGSGMLRKEDTDRQILQNRRQVQCQRFFVQKEHSQYFEVRTKVVAEGESTGRGSEEEIWSQAWVQASQHYENIRADETIRPGETDEVNPWLRRTGWIPYLEGCDRKDILRCVREPTVDDETAEGENETNDNERIAAAVWQAMGDLVSVSQDTVSRSGIMLRFEAIRTEAHQNVYRPLEPYQNRDDIGRQGRYWQQIVTFFVHTRQDHTWKSPVYKFNHRQDRAFQRMMAAARLAVDGAGEPSDSESDSTESDSDVEGELIAPAIADVQQACLLFCVELLNQTIHNCEYDMALVCGLAALGINPSGRGFRGADTYPSILSAVIKVAHFMIVQQAERIAQPTAGEYEEFSAGRSLCDFEDSGYESEEARVDKGGGRNRGGKSSFEWVRKMIDGFIVRGCGSPM
jgi:hypothetical protein